MNLKRSSFYILVVMLGVNAFSMMMQEAGIGPVGLQPAFNLTSMEQNLDANATLADYSWTTVFYADFIFGVLTWIGVVWGLVAGFPQLMIAAGVPSFITDPLYIVWLFITFTSIILGVIGGQDA